MFDDENSREDPSESPRDPALQAQEKADEFRVHAQLAAVFEGPRKFDAQLLTNLDPDLARDLQRTIARLEKSKTPDSPILPSPSVPDAQRLLTLPQTSNLSTNDYHLHRRPGEVMIVRWLQGPQVDAFYQRLQAHFDVAITDYREEFRSANQWKQDPKTLAYLDALDKIEIRMADRYLREPLRQHPLFVLSTQSADEIDILHLSDYIMGLSAADLVGPASAPPAEDPSEQDRAWFFKLFSLRGSIENVEHMCFFTFLQKTDDSSW